MSLSTINTTTTLFFFVFFFFFFLFSVIKQTALRPPQNIHSYIMKPQTLLLVALAGLASSASIQKRSSSSSWPGAVREFFAAVSDELRDWKQHGGNHEPACDFSQNARMPTSALPPPSTGLVLYHVAIGRGTQVSLFFPFSPFFSPHSIRKVVGD